VTDKTFANGAPMDLAAAEATHRMMYPHLYGPAAAQVAADVAARVAARAEQIGAEWAAEAAEVAELEQLCCGPDRDRPAGRL
jgi:hypothetical protein